MWSSRDQGESVIVVMDANRSKASVDAVCWALKHVVRPKDTVVVLGILCELGRKTSCFPFHMGMGTAGIFYDKAVIQVHLPTNSKLFCQFVNLAISMVSESRFSRLITGESSYANKKRLRCEVKAAQPPTDVNASTSGERLELSGSEVNPKELEEEIEKKREQYQSSLQPIYRQCRKNEVKLEVKLAAGFDAKKITIEEAQNSNTRWIVLDSHLKKEKVFIYGQVDCNIAVMKGKDVATLMVPKASGCSQIPQKITRVDAANIITPDQPQTQPDDEDLNDLQEDLCRPAPAPQSPCWYPLAWRTGFPRSFTLTELEEITNRFGDENIVLDHGDIKLYDGILQETPVLVQRFSGNDQGKFWSEFKILSRVRHRNIMNLVGYCCTGSCLFLLFDYPCMGSLEVNLRHNAVTRKKMILKPDFIMYEGEDKAENLSWRLRWYIAQEIGVTLRYLHEECADGPILCNFSTAKLLKDDTPFNEASQAECPKVEQDEYLSADVHDYGVFLLELIAGKSASDFEAQGSGQSLIDWALPLLENDSLGEVMDPRIADTNDVRLVHHMARAALFCLKNDSGRRLSISEMDNFSEHAWYLPSVSAQFGHAVACLPETNSGLLKLGGMTE
ncbi:uncharacterized protein LOC104881004 [Vitis vinifera]|uniref:uncharacterized protein LOC104881004 n=1 Tax=Vitis vinifera TaxID=29760 RepID=UPI0008FEC1F7|nr:uncharacterized protein LOC104881004 [Vitis vinifera]|eukprot:XP_019078958.1 PREDICTED: uncharacterized protein LOC104881004 [Vitis vinifera]